MRAKRSRDKPLVEKFSRQRDSLAAESLLHQPVKPPPTTTTITTTADDEDDAMHNSDEDEDDIKASNSNVLHFFVLLGFLLSWVLHIQCVWSSVINTGGRNGI